MSEIKNLPIETLIRRYAEVGAELEGCSFSESYDSVVEKVKDYLIDEITWCYEMLEK